MSNFIKYVSLVCVPLSSFVLQTLQDGIREKSSPLKWSRKFATAEFHWAVSMCMYCVVCGRQGQGTGTGT